ncbi:MAG TPA: cellulase family glycosylhydrolase [Prolixibacteraceae bacterium]|nr:cellulase family glycosylhydrolase [Prolixibacteraceae bacterium]
MKKILLYFLLLLCLQSRLSAQNVYTVEGSQILKNGIAWEFVGADNMAVFGLPYNYSTQQSQGMDISRECIDMKMTSDAALQTLVNSARSKGQVLILAGFWYDSDAFSGGKTAYPGCQLLGANPMADSRYAAIMKRWKEIVSLPFIKNKTDVWINPWNEPYSWEGKDGYTNDMWEKDSKSIVDSIRSTGANNIIALNGSHMGQGHAVIIERGKNVRQGRTNIIFDIHAYGRWDVGVTAIRSRFKALRDAGNAFIIGEFAANGDYFYQSIMDACRADRVSLLAWLWGQYKEPFASIYKKYTMAPRNPESIDVSIVGKDQVVPGESNLRYRLSSFSNTWTMQWTVKGGGKIVGKTDSTAVLVDWSCLDDSLFCHINTGTKNITIPFGVKVSGFTINSPVFVSAGQADILLQTPYVKNATYKWTLPEGAAFVGKADSSEIVIKWGTKTDTVRLSIEGPCGTSAITKVLFLSGKYPYPDPNSPHLLPGTIESDAFDYGGEGIAYHDLDVANVGSGNRPDDGVDTEMNDGGGNIGWTDAGEWMSYSIKVDKPGKYFAELRVASGDTGGSLNILINNENRFGTLKIPGTGGWATFASIYPGKVELKATDNELRYFCVTDGFNIGRLIIWPLDIIPPSKPALSLTTTRNTTQMVKWHQSTDNDQISRYVIYLNNDSVQSITDSTYTFRNLKAGTQYSYKVVAVDKQGNRSEPLTGDFTTWVTGINGLQNENIIVYPNPFNDDIRIEGLEAKTAQLEIYDTVGKLVFKDQLESGQNSIIHASFLKKGIYVLRVHQNGIVSNVKIVKN